MTYSVYSEGKCYASGLTYDEAVNYCVYNDYFRYKKVEICEDNGIVNKEDENA